MKTFNNNIYINNINSINQKPVATPMNKNNLNKKMSIGFPVNFSNVKRKILSKEKNKNNNINNINNIINNMNGNSNKFANNNRVEFNSTHHSKEKNYGTIKSNSQNKKIVEEITRLQNDISENKKTREETEEAILEMLRVMITKMKGEIERERKDRELTEETFLTILEETTNKLNQTSQI